MVESIGFVKAEVVGIGIGGRTVDSHPVPALAEVVTVPFVALELGRGIGAMVGRAPGKTVKFAEPVGAPAAGFSTGTGTGAVGCHSS